VKVKSDLGEAKLIIEQILSDDECYRRDLGIYGADDMKVKMRKHRFDGSVAMLRWWYNSRYPKSK